MDLSTRAKILTRRTYNRPLDEAGLSFETWDQTVDRVLMHQNWLWNRAAGLPLDDWGVFPELGELGELMRARKVLPAGRTLWLGGTEVARMRECSQFNCAHVNVETTHDVVDFTWLMLNGAGVGFTPQIGTLNGFAQPINDIRVIRSERAGKGGAESNEELWDASTGVWTIRVGDSGEAWAKALGKLLAGKYPARVLVFDFSELRPAGSRLSRYGWISSGDTVIADGFPAIARILSRRAGQLLTKQDIWDILNWVGVIQTGRRGAEIGLIPYGDNEWREIANFKREYWIDNPQRAQSNNSLVFYGKPDVRTLRGLFDTIIESGGSEPGFINGEAALRRAPWFKGVNPCAEILLGNKSFCNLVEVNVAAFRNDPAGLHRAVYLVARANYRQTCVNLDDGILQRAWHENNEFLRLCGVGLTGLARRPDLGPYEFRQLRNAATIGAYSMADELGLPRPKNVTTVKPSGTASKIMDTTEGVHKPMGRYIFNNITFSVHDPLLNLLRDAGYRMFPNPDQKDGMLVTFPVEWADIEFERVGDKHVNLESAVGQLERYRTLMENYVDQNCSITVSYDRSEVSEMVDWIDHHWDSYVGVSFLPRNDPTKTAKDLGYPYLPQEVVTRDEFSRYASELKPVNPDAVQGVYDIDAEECAGGVCPVR